MEMAGRGQRRKTKSRFPSRSPRPLEIAAAIPTFPQRHDDTHSQPKPNRTTEPKQLRKAHSPRRYSLLPFRPILRLENALLCCVVLLPRAGARRK